MDRGLIFTSVLVPPIKSTGSKDKYKYIYLRYESEKYRSEYWKTHNKVNIFKWSDHS